MKQIKYLNTYDTMLELLFWLIIEHWTWVNNSSQSGLEKSSTEIWKNIRKLRQPTTGIHNIITLILHSKDQINHHSNDIQLNYQNTWMYLKLQWLNSMYVKTKMKINIKICFSLMNSILLILFFLIPLCFAWIIIVSILL